MEFHDDESWRGLRSLDTIPYCSGGLVRCNGQHTTFGSSFYYASRSGTAHRHAFSAYVHPPRLGCVNRVFFQHSQSVPSTSPVIHLPMNRKNNSPPASAKNNNDSIVLDEPSQFRPALAVSSFFHPSILAFHKTNNCKPKTQFLHNHKHNEQFYHAHETCGER